jgi:release factor glutamine methyltransferase
MEDIIIKALAAKKNKEFILAHPEYHLNFGQKLRWFYFSLLKKIGYPLAYLTGHKEFYGLDFLVNKYTLIPRPETELLVENAIEKIKKIGNEKIVLLDIGTGTGCIPIAIAKNIIGANLMIRASDISSKALRLAIKNANQHKVNIKFIQASLLDKKIILEIAGQFVQHLILTANLPYLTQEQFLAEPSIQKEPRESLVADDKDGLSLYEKLLIQIAELYQSKKDTLTKFIHHRSGSSTPSLTIFLEIDPRQTIGINALIKKILPQAKFEIKKDLAGRDRLVKIEIN